jgi:hypothetical protein
MASILELVILTTTTTIVTKIVSDAYDEAVASDEEQEHA